MHASLVDRPVKKPVEQAGFVVEAHREPEPSDREALAVDAAHVVEPAFLSSVVVSFHGCDVLVYWPFWRILTVQIPRTVLSLYGMNQLAADHS